MLSYVCVHTYVLCTYIHIRVVTYSLLAILARSNRIIILTIRKTAALKEAPAGRKVFMREKIKVAL